MELARAAARVIVAVCLVLAARGAHAEGFIPCREAVAQQKFLPLLAWMDGRQYPFVVTDESSTWKEAETGAYEVVVHSKPPRKGTVADISDDAKEAFTRFDGCLALDRRNFLLTDYSNGSNFSGLYHFDVTRSSFEFDPDKRLAPGFVRVVAEVNLGRGSKILVISHDFTNRTGNYSGYAVFHAGSRRPKQGPAFYELVTVTDNRECGADCGAWVRPEGEVVIWVGRDRKRALEVKTEDELEIRFLGIRQDGSETPSIEFELHKPSGTERLRFRIGAEERFVLQR